MKIVSIALSLEKGATKSWLDQALLMENHGIQEDAHAENIATTGIDWKNQPLD